MLKLNRRYQYNEECDRETNRTRNVTNVSSQVDEFVWGSVCLPGLDWERSTLGIAICVFHQAQLHMNPIRPERVQH